MFDPPPFPIIIGPLYEDETIPLLENRWAKLVKDFKSKSGWFDISKIPDIYDCIKYDMLHNRSLHFKSAPDVTSCAMPLADIVIPQVQKRKTKLTVVK